MYIQTNSLHMIKTDLFDRIDTYTDLDENWNGYGSERISQYAIDTTKEILDSFESAGIFDTKINVYAFPMSSGGIQIEIDSDKFSDEIEVISEENIHYYSFTQEEVDLEVSFPVKKEEFLKLAKTIKTKHEHN
jgi:hypothetical protein